MRTPELTPTAVRIFKALSVRLIQLELADRFDSFLYSRSLSGFVKAERPDIHRLCKGFFSLFSFVSKRARAARTYIAVAACIAYCATALARRFIAALRRVFLRS